MDSLLLSYRWKLFLVKLDIRSMPEIRIAAALGDLTDYQQGSGLTVAQVARLMGRELGSDYAKENAPRSPNPLITGNHQPGVSRLEWLRGRSKCNQFIGDVLTLAGFETPLHRMADGSFHYALAEELPRAGDYFEPVRDPRHLRSGDIIIVDYPRGGENGAHAYVVISYDQKNSRLIGLSAESRGVRERDISAHLKNIGRGVFAIRPKLQRQF